MWTGCRPGQKATKRMERDMSRVVDSHAFVASHCFQTVSFNNWDIYGYLKMNVLFRIFLLLDFVEEPKNCLELWCSINECVVWKTILNHAESNVHNSRLSKMVWWIRIFSSSRVISSYKDVEKNTLKKSSNRSSSNHLSKILVRGVYQRTNPLQSQFEIRLENPNSSK